MVILMQETRRGSPDGFDVYRYEKGRIYDLPDSLARRFIRAGWASESAHLTAEYKRQLVESV